MILIKELILWKKLNLKKNKNVLEDLLGKDTSSPNQIFK